MRIGITCYPTYGGSGALATELGIALAGRGHEVHFITYRQPERLPVGVEVDLVPATGERDAELRRERAGAAVGGVAGDADAHVSRPLRIQAPASLPAHHLAARSRASGASGSTTVTSSPRS